MITIIVEYVKIYKTRKKQKKLFPVISMYGKQLSGIVMSRTTELTTIYNNFILLKQKPDSFEAKPWFFWNKNMTILMTAWILTTQTWFFQWNFEFSETQSCMILFMQTWILRNANLISTKRKQRKLELKKRQTWFLRKSVTLYGQMEFWILTFCFSYLSCCFAFSLQYFGFGF